MQFSSRALLPFAVCVTVFISRIRYGLNQAGAVSKLASAAILAALMAVGGGQRAQAQDVTPPVLVSFDFTPTQVDTSSASASVTVSLHITDDLSGFNNGYVQFVNPSHANSALAFVSRVSGTATDGMYAGTATIPAFSEPGTWTAYYAQFTDTVGNVRQYSMADLVAAGFPTNLTVISLVDSMPPALVSFDFTPTQVDTSSASASVTVSLHITDDLSGFNNGYVQFVNPSHANSALAFVSRVSGTATDGMYAGTATIPAFSEPGTWTAYYAQFTDTVGNVRQYSMADLVAAGFPTNLTVISLVDSMPPVLASFDFTPKQVNTSSASASVTVSLHITDDLSGFNNGYVQFVNPSHANSALAFVSRVSGTATDGMYAGTATIPAFSEPGTWTAYYAQFTDTVGNVRQYSMADLVAAGFPTTLKNGPSPIANVSPGSLAFGDEIVGVATTAQSVTVESIGVATLSISNVSLGGANPGDFSFTASYPIAIVSGASTPINVRFSPTTTGPRTATLIITDDDSSSPQLVTLTGTGKTLTSTSISSFANPSTFGQSVTFVATVTGTGGVPTGTVSFSDGGIEFGSGTLDGTGKATLGTSSLSVATHTIRAGYQGNSTFAVSTSAALTQTVNPASNTITFNPLADQPFGTGPFTVSATASSGLVVGFASMTSPVCTVSGATVTLLALGTCTIQATQTGDATYAAATPVNQSFQVTQVIQSQSITFGALPNQPLGAIPFAVAATASSGLAVGFASTTPSVCTVSGTIVTLVAVGTCTIQATQAGNGSYAAAMPVNQSFEVTFQGLGTNSILVGSAGGSSSVVLAYSGTWTATANDSFLHIGAGSANGTNSGLVVFTYDAFPGTGTRTGTLTIAGLTVTVTQAGTNYIGPGPVTTLVSSGLNSPAGVAVDTSGNLYIADQNNNAIKKWSASTQQLTTLVSSGLNSPFGVAVDGSGNVYITDRGNAAIKEWSASTQQVTTLVSGLFNAYLVAVDGSGNVYFADPNNGAVKEWSPSTQQVTTLVSSGLGLPYGVAVDASRNVYITDASSNTVKEWNASTQQVTTLVSSGLIEPTGVAVDGSGNLYIADFQNKAIKEWSASTQQVTTLASSGLNGPLGAAVDGSGNVYIGEVINNAIKQIPNAFVGPFSLTELSPAGSDSLLQVLPSTTSLVGNFAPTSDQSWLTIGTIANGVINFSFTANTSGSARTANITVLGQQITVTQTANTPPAITSAASATFTVGIVGAVTVTATGNPAPTLSESGPLPNGVTFDTATHTLSGIPAAGTDGTYNITFSASNGVGSDAVQAFSLIVGLPSAASVTVSPTSVPGGFANSIGTVTLNAPAVGTVAQRRVTLSSDNTTVATVPATVTVAAGATSANFTITSLTVASTATVNLSATLNGGTQSALLTVTPGPSVASVALNPTSVFGGITNSIGTVTLNAPAAGTAAQRAVTLSSDNPAAATVPATVTVAIGATSANFTITSLTVASTATANISATLNGSTQSASVTVTPGPGVASVTLNPTSVFGGITNSIGTVTLNGPAVGTAAQRKVTLSSDNTAAATVPATVTVAIGATSANFTITSLTVASTTTANISATLNGGTQSASLTVTPGPGVASVTLNPTSVPGGITNSIGTVTLNAPAAGTAAQRAVTLSSDNSAAATVPATVTVAIGATSANFTITSLTVASTTTANISATLNGGTQSASLTVTPGPGVASVTLNPTSVPGGITNSIGTVTLNAPAVGTAAQRRVTLSSDNTAAATVPATVTVAIGATSANFTITSLAVPSTATANISATSNGVTQSAVLTVTPPSGVLSLSLNPTSVVGGSANSTATVTLNAPAAGTVAQRTVTLSSDNAAAATVPATVTVAAGAITATFTVTSHVVAATANPAITATLNGSTNATLTVNPLLVLDVALNPASVVGGSENSTATLTLNAAAAGTVAQRTITISSGNAAAATVPVTVVAPVGATSVSFTVASHAGPIGAVIISATINGGTQSATLTVTP